MGLFSFLKRDGNKKTQPQRRSYAGARVTNLTASWAAPNTSGDVEVFRDLVMLRNRSRDLARNNPLVRKYLQMLRKNVVGPHGIRLQVRARDPNGQLDNWANNTIESEWALWSKRGNCDVTGRLSWVDVQSQVVQSVARDGEVLVRLVRGYANRWRFAVQLIEADHLDVRFNDVSRNIRMGVEYDEWGKPIAYHLLTRHPGDTIGMQIDVRRERVPADELLHVFVADRPSQNRGVPWLHSVILSSQMLNGYKEAELVAARMAAAKAGFYIKDGGDQFAADDYDGATPVQEIEPGMIEILPGGWDFKPYDPQHPTTAFDTFTRSVTREIASGLDVNYHMLSGDLENVNYSSIRAGTLDERDTWRTLQQFYIEHLCQPVYEAWLEMTMLSGAINLPVAKFDKFTQTQWQPRGWAWVDPQKDMTAQIAAIKAGLKTAAQVASETGQDIEEIYAQLAQEKALREQYGITTEYDVGVAANEADAAG